MRYERFGQTGQIVVPGGVPQLLGGAALLGDVLDVGDREHHAVVLGGRHPGAGPDELAVATPIALIDAERVDDAEFEPSSVRLRRAHVVGVGELAQACSRRVRSTSRRSISPSDWLASTMRPSSRRTSAIPVGADWNACWNRRRAWSSARVCCSRSETSRRRTTSRSVVDRTLGVLARQVERGLDHDPPIGASDHLDLDRVDVVTVERPLHRSPRDGLFVAVGVIEQVSVDEVAGGHVEHASSAAALVEWTTTVAVDEQHRLGEFVEQAPDLGLGRLDRVELALEHATAGGACSRCSGPAWRSRPRRRRWRRCRSCCSRARLRPHGTSASHLDTRRPMAW